MNKMSQIEKAKIIGLKDELKEREKEIRKIQNEYKEKNEERLERYFSGYAHCMSDVLKDLEELLK
jgi:hypothetical protein